MATTNRPTCSNCGSSDFETDASRGDTVCIRCGIVVEDNAIVNEIQFEEGGTSVIGQRVNEECGNRSFSAVLMGVSKDSRHVTLGT
jgi:transcription initiation factor TFIIIB Brf1 subunit/transcription initiation factor TFIIB